MKKLMNPGFLMMLLSLVLFVCADALAGKIAPEKKDKAKGWIRAAGYVLVTAGAVVMKIWNG